ncbi:AraC family transcriptional regulator [Streptomyces tsukubensis]|uniref:AraC family transcriptional regulator n=1 Tax=Streptomyces tsukubensis TaxID=83656 RepID=A0A1V3ZYA1_9ACTN|nr:AraC family transcriptional regulator [Streptomyces tsukubensis]OON71363.1 AraC family transcriptional regulator [Streptomyces tsukubensis]QFR92325.1 helix-turn-helix domain-containing protein [Streptomyces tsukubensis]
MLREPPRAYAKICLDRPPDVASLGVGVHGTVSPRDVFRLPDLWQLHVYQYTADLVVDGVRHVVRPGHVSLVPPGAVVEFRYRGRSEHLYAHFALPMAEDGETLELPVVQAAGAASPALSDLLRQAVAAAPHHPARAAAELWAVLWRVAGLATRTGGGTGEDTPVDAAVAHIESHLAGPLTVPDVAAAAGVSHNHLGRLFKAATGDTVVAYIRQRRMERARHLLRESTLSIPAVAASVGIGDLQAFNKVCRRELGLSPRAVRAGE